MTRMNRRAWCFPDVPSSPPCPNYRTVMSFDMVNHCSRKWREGTSWRRMTAEIWAIRNDKNELKGVWSQTYQVVHADPTTTDWCRPTQEIFAGENVRKARVDDPASRSGCMIKVAMLIKLLWQFAQLLPHVYLFNTKHLCDSKWQEWTN